MSSSSACHASPMVYSSKKGFLAAAAVYPCVGQVGPPCGVREKALVHSSRRFIHVGARSEADAAKTQPDAIARLVRLVALASVHRMPANVRAHKAFVLCWLRLRPWRWMCSGLAAANTSSRGCATSSASSVSGGKECEQQHRRRGEKETGQMRRASDNQRQACVPRGRGQSPVRLQDTASGQRNSSAQPTSAEQQRGEAMGGPAVDDIRARRILRLLPASVECSASARA